MNSNYPVLILSLMLRAFYHFLATGESRDANWYRGLADADEISNATTVTSGLFDFMKEDEGPEESGENTEDTDKETDEERNETDEETNETGEETNGIEEEDTGEWKNGEKSLVQLSAEFETEIEMFKSSVIERLEQDFAHNVAVITAFTKGLSHVRKMNGENFKTSLFFV